MTTSRALLRLLLFLLTSVAMFARPPSVVTSNTILADLVREVGGDAVEIACLARTGADLHEFEPRPADVRTLSRADLVVLNGLGLEPWIDRLVDGSGFQGRRVEASDGVDPIHPEHDEHDHGVDDPHAWHDPECVRIYVRNIRLALSNADPANAQGFVDRERDFLERLDRIEAWARKEMSRIPQEERRVVTSHDSLAYLGRAYGIQFIPVTGVSASGEPSARQVAAVIDLIRSSGVRAVFFGSADNPTLMRRIASDAGTRLGGRLYTDSLGEPGSGAETYLGMFEQNLRQILDSLR